MGIGAMNTLPGGHCAEETMPQSEPNVGSFDGSAPQAVLTEQRPDRAPNPVHPPLISVLMPTYNPGRYVAAAIESILAQTFADFEFLISDAGSTDGSLEVMARYAERDPRIRLAVKPKLGIVGALNELLGRARGDLVARMDADDIALPGRFQQQVDYLNEHPECVLVGSRVLIIDPDGEELTVLGRALTHEQIVDDLLACRGQMIYHPTVMFRRAVVARIGGYDEKMKEAEDLDLFLRLAEVGQIVNLPEPLVKYREHLKKSGRVRAKDLVPYTKMIVNEARKRRGMGPLPESKRSTCEPQTAAEVYRAWGWWALMSGYVPRARKHAWASLTHAPLSLSSWRLMYCALRGR
jgi:glycosyltransferase involved in cell wall biosynthesis